MPTARRLGCGCRSTTASITGPWPRRGPTLPEPVYAAAWEAGRRLASEQAAAEALAEPAAPAAKPPAATRGGQSGGLTAREREVLLLLVAGMTDRQIAETLFISHRTTQVHVAGIFSKLGVNTRTAAATAALRLGLAEPDAG